MMKRILAALLIFMMVMTCVSCKKDEGGDALTGLPGTGYEDQRDEESNTDDPAVNEDEQGGNNETPSTDTPADETPDQKEESKDPTDETPSNQDEPKDEDSKQEEQKPAGDDQPQEEQKPGAEEETSPYPGAAVTFSAESVKISQSGSYSDLRSLQVQTVGGETLFLLNSLDGVEQFNNQISAWMENSSSEDEEEEEEAILFDLESELGRTYGNTYFEEKSLLLLCVSGSVGAVKAVTVENGQLNFYMEKASNAGAGVLGDMSTSIVAVEVPSASIAECSMYKINTI